MLHNLILKNIATAMSSNVLKMLALKPKRKFALCSIVALLVYVVDQIYLSVSFTPPVFLLGNFG